MGMNSDYFDDSKVQCKECDAGIVKAARDMLDTMGLPVLDFKVSELMYELNKVERLGVYNAFAISLMKYGYTRLRSRMVEDAKAEKEAE